MNKEIGPDSVNSRRSEREAQRIQASSSELIELIARIVREDGTVEPLKGLHLHRSAVPKEPLHSVYEPVFCVIAQGSKEIFLGNERYQYDSDHYLLVTAELPIVGHVLEASQERPYLSFRLDLDPALVSAVMVETDYAPSKKQDDVRAIAVSPLEADLLEAVVRLVRLAAAPAEARFLAPLIRREIIYRLLMGEQGDRLRYVAVVGGYSPHIIKAIERLTTDFDQSLRIASLARELGMSVSSFHHHFKAVTAMSPLQFQKRLRLQEARRLMLSERLDAASAAYRVGYDDPAHFNREYKKLFGLPPMRDVERLRAMARLDGGLGAD